VRTPPLQSEARSRRHPAQEDAGATIAGKLAPSELGRLEREIVATDAEIDELVYELYGITDEDRKIVEESMGAKQG
jgi:hypothetical protein